MPAAVAEFQLLMTGLADEVARSTDRLADVLAEVSQRDALSVITDAYPELMWQFLAASGDLTATFYEEQPGDTGYVATVADLAAKEQLSASARWAALQKDPRAALRGVSTRNVFDASRNTVILNTEREGVRWARHAAPNACGFCRMLATRGAVYRSEDSANRVTGRSVDLTLADRRAIASGRITRGEALARRSIYRSARQANRQGKVVGDKRALGRTRGLQNLGDRYHNHCHCTAVPDRNGSYEPASYVEQWESDYIEAVKGGAQTPGQIAHAMDKASGRSRRGGAAGGTGSGTPRRRDGQTRAGVGGGGRGPHGPGGPPTTPPVQPMPAGGDEPRPPKRVRGMLGPSTADEFPTFNGWTPPALRSEIEEFSLLDAEIVLDGDGSGHGEHRAGTGTKSDEFPSAWSEQDVIDLVNSVVDAPTDGMAGRSAVRFSLLGTYRGVQAVIRFRNETGAWRVSTVHPFDRLHWERERDRLGL